MFVSMHKVNQVLSIIESVSILKVPIEDYKYIPLIYLIKHVHTHDLNAIWPHLPLGYKNCLELQQNLPCFEHYNLPDQRDHIDGPAPAKKFCCS